MFVEGSSGVRLVRTDNDQFVGLVRDGDGHAVFGPYASRAEVVAVVRDWLLRDLRAAQVEDGG